MDRLRLPLSALFVVCMAVGVFADPCPKPNQNGECKGQHCSVRSTVVNSLCKTMWQTVGRDRALPSVFLECGQHGYCYCKCSCPVGDTPVRVPGGWTNIKQLSGGASVMALSSNKQWVAREVKFSDGSAGTDGYDIPNMINLKTAGGHNLVVTSDHPFLVEGWTLKAAMQLSTQDKVIDAETLRPVAISSVEVGTYRGSIWNIATSDTSAGPGEPLEDHLINTAGVVSGDFYAELFLLPDHHSSLAKIFDDQQQQLSGEGAVPARDPNFVRATPFNKSAEFIAFGSGSMASFLPQDHEEAAAGMLVDPANTTGLEEADYLAFQFQMFYPNIRMHVRDYWHDDTVNAFAWREGTTQHVALLGGLIRHKLVSSSGLAVVLAHEIGHHLGGEPRYTAGNTWASCEGQSDYWGALVAMRRVFWGPESIKRIKAGAEELYKLFSGGLKSPLKLHAEGPCSHPPALCRRDTYLAAAKLDPKPACAGPPGSKESHIRPQHTEL